MRQLRSHLILAATVLCSFGAIVGVTAHTNPGTATTLPDATKVPSRVISVDLRDGSETKRVMLPGKRSLDTGYVTKGLLIVERPRCLSMDRTPAGPGDDMIAAIDPVAGTTRWTRDDVRLVPALAAEPPGLGTVLVQDSVSSSKLARLRALDPVNGRHRWSASATRNRVLAVSNDTVIVTGSAGDGESTADRDVRALDLATGAVRWRFTLPGATDLAASIGDGLVAVSEPFPASTTQPVSILHAAHGTAVTTISIPAGHYAGLVGTVLVVVSPSLTSALAHDARSGAERWELRDARAVVGTRDTLITAAPGPPFAYTGRDLFTSIPKWSVAVPYYSGILVNRETIVLQASELTAIDSTSGTTRWTSDYPSIFPTRYPDDALGPTFRTYIGDSALIVAGGCALTSAN